MKNEKCALELAKWFGIDAKTFDELPKQFRGFCADVGFVKIISWLALLETQNNNINRGKSMFLDITPDKALKSMTGRRIAAKLMDNGLELGQTS